MKSSGVYLASVCIVFSLNRPLWNCLDVDNERLVAEVRRTLIPDHGARHQRRVQHLRPRGGDPQGQGGAARGHRGLVIRDGEPLQAEEEWVLCGGRSFQRRGRLPHASLRGNWDEHMNR